MLKWYKITAKSPEALRNVLHSLKKQRLMVRERDEILYVCINPDHQVWLTRVCGDFNAMPEVLKEAPKGMKHPQKEEYTAPCGEKFYDPILVSTHVRNCPNCRELKGKPKVKPRKPKVPVIAKLAPGQELNLNGVIASLEIIREELWEKLENLDNLLTNLKGYRDSREELNKLSTEVDQRIEAVKLLLKDDKLPNSSSQPTEGK